MADLYFKTEADYTAIVALQTRIKSLEASLRNVNPVITPRVEIDKMEKDLSLAKQKFNALVTQAASAGSRMTQAGIIAQGVGKNFGQFAKDIDNSNQSLAETTRELTMLEKAFSGMSGGFSNYIQRFGAASLAWRGINMAIDQIKGTVSTIMSFEAENARLAAIAGMTKAELDGMSQSALDLGRKTVFTASQVTQLQIELAKLGFQANDIHSMEESVLAFAQATGASLADAASTTGAVVRMFGASTEETSRYVGAMASATMASALDFRTISENIAQFGPVAHQMGMEVEDALALFGALKNAGVNGSTAATSLRNIMNEMAGGKLYKQLGYQVKSLDDFVRAMKDLEGAGYAGADGIKKSMDAIGKRGGSQFLALINQADKLGELRDRIRDGEEGLGTMGDKMVNNLQGQLKMLSSAWEGLILQFRGSDGVAKDVVESITNGINKITDNIEEATQIVGSFLALIALVKTSAFIKNEGGIIMQRIEEKSLESEIDLYKEKRDAILQTDAAEKKTIGTTNAKIVALQESKTAALAELAAIREAKIQEMLLHRQATDTLLMELAAKRDEVILNQVEIEQKEGEILANQHLMRQAAARGDLAARDTFQAAILTKEKEKEVLAKKREVLVNEQLALEKKALIRAGMGEIAVIEGDTAATNANNAAKGRGVVVTKALGKAWKGLKGLMMATGLFDPLTLAIAGIAAAVWAFHKAFEDVRQEQEYLNEAQEKFRDATNNVTEETKKTIDNVGKLGEKINMTVEGSKARMEAENELAEMYEKQGIELDVVKEKQNSIAELAKKMSKNGITLDVKYKTDDKGNKVLDENNKPIVIGIDTDKALDDAKKKFAKDYQDLYSKTSIIGDGTYFKEKEILETQEKELEALIKQEGARINNLSYADLMIEKQDELNQKIKDEANLKKIDAVEQTSREVRNKEVDSRFEKFGDLSGLSDSQNAGLRQFQEYLRETISDEELNRISELQKRIKELQVNSFSDALTDSRSVEQRKKDTEELAKLQEELNKRVSQYNEVAETFTDTVGDNRVYERTKQVINGLAAAYGHANDGIKEQIKSLYEQRVADYQAENGAKKLTDAEIRQAEINRRTKMSAQYLKEELLQIAKLDGNYQMIMDVIVNAKIPKWMKDQYGIGEDGKVGNIDTLRKNTAHFQTLLEKSEREGKKGAKIGDTYYSNADLAERVNQGLQAIDAHEVAEQAEKNAKEAADAQAKADAKTNSAAAANEAAQRREREKAFEKTIYQFAEKRKELLQKNSNDIAQAEIKAMKEGAAKVNAQREFDRKNRIESIKKQSNDEKKSYWDELAKIYNADPEHFSQSAKDTTKKSEGRVGKDKNVMMDYSILVNLKEEDRNKVIAEMQAYFDKIKDDPKYKNLVENGLEFDIMGFFNLTDSKMNAELGTQYRELYNELDESIKKYQDSEARVVAINKKYDDDLAIMRSKYEAIVSKDIITPEDEEILRRYEAALKELEKQRNKEVFNEEFNRFKEQPEYYSVFQNTAQSSTEDIQKVYDYLEQHQSDVVQMFKDSPKEMRAYFDEMEKLFDELVKRDPFETLRKSVDEYKEAVVKAAKVDTLTEQKRNLENGRVQIEENLKNLQSQLEDAKKSGDSKMVVSIETQIIGVKGQLDLNTKQLDNVSTELNEAVIAKNAIPRLKKVIESSTDAILDSVDGLVSGLEAIANQIGDIVGEITGNLASMFGSIRSGVTSLRGEGMTKKVARIGADGNPVLDAKGNAVMDSKLTAQGKMAAAQMVMQIAAQTAGMMKNVFKYADDAASNKYEKFAKKQAEWNKMSDAVYDYRKAVLASELAEKSWFSSTGLSGLRDAWQQNQLASESYFAKLNEQQAEYKNKGAGIKKVGVIAAGVTAAAAAVVLSVVTFGGAAAAIGGAMLTAAGAAAAATTTAATVVGATVLAAGAAVSASAVAAGATVALAKYNKQTVAAVDNLKIETRKKTFWKSQKTENVAEWAKKNLGIDLFGKDDRLNTKAAEVILDKYGDKLQGEAQATLQQLLDIQKEYDEFEKQLKDYVSQMYNPLVDDMTEAVMTWLDTGQDALYTFKQSANQTFRDIAKEMVKDLVNQQIFGTYGDDIKNLYQQYASGAMNEGQLAQYVTDMTADLEKRAEVMLPAVETFTKTISDTFNQMGVDITDSNITSGSSRGYSGMSQETGESLDGRMAAIQISNETIAQYMMRTYDTLSLMNVNFDTISESMSKVDINVSALLDIQNNSFLELKAISMNTYETAQGVANTRIEIQKLANKLENL